MGKNGPRCGVPCDTLVCGENRKRTAMRDFGALSSENLSKLSLLALPLREPLRGRFPSQNLSGLLPLFLLPLNLSPRDVFKVVERLREANARSRSYIRNGPNTVSGSTVSNTELSEFFGAHWVPGSELSELLSAYYLCAKANSPSFSQNSPSLP